MERNYWGCDLRQEQIDANEEQSRALLTSGGLKPKWVCGDSRQTLENSPQNVDFIFSCPPYGDLEVYSSLPDDLSNMTWHKFLEAYQEIIMKSAQRLRNNRFACFVVGDFRDRKTGAYRNFPAYTIFSWLKAGLQLHNDAVLITSVGSLPVRAQKSFEVSRKLGKSHQNILVFVKGDARKAAAACEPTPSY